MLEFELPSATARSARRLCFPIPSTSHRNCAYVSTNREWLERAPIAHMLDYRCDIEVERSNLEGVIE